jgi:hypothetical protein
MVVDGAAMQRFACPKPFGMGQNKVHYTLSRQPITEGVGRRGHSLVGIPVT